jgi:type II secretory pathway component PulF
MIFTAIFGAAAEVSAFNFAVGLGDATVMGLASSSLIDAFVDDQSPEEQLTSAKAACRQYRWNLHKAKQMMQLANELVKMKSKLGKFSRELLDNIEEENRRMEKQIKKWKREFKPTLFATVASTIGVVLIFLLIGLGKGTYIRDHLNMLRHIEHEHGY